MPKFANLSEQSNQAGAAGLNATAKVFSLPPGLYVVRLMATASGAAPNPATLSQAPGSKARVDFLAVDSAMGQTLTNEGDCMVIRVLGEAAMLTVTEYHSGAPQSVRLKIERLDAANATDRSGAQGTRAAGGQPTASVLRPGQKVKFEVEEPDGANSPAAQPQATHAQPTRPALRHPANPCAGVSLHVVGHVQGQGDVVSRDNWIGAPGSNNRLEGFAIRAEGLPEGVRLVYGCKFIAPTRKSQVTNLGKFVGTRQKAEAIRSLIFGLEGPGADQYEVAGQVAFSGRAVREIVAATELRGPTGNEHVVAFNLRVVPKVATVPLTSASSTEDDDGVWATPQDGVATQVSDVSEPTQNADHLRNLRQSDDADDSDGAWGDDDIEKLFSR